MKGQDNRKYAIYSRKSKFTGKGESIENQIELCRQHIKLHHENVTEEDILIFEDEGFSGGNVNRPQFQAMMKQIRANQIQAVVCYRLDRISRTVGDFAKLKDEFDYYNVEFTSIRDDFDTTSPSGRAMMMMVSVFAQLERETTAERIRDNMHELAKSGRWLGGTTPTGYKSTQIVGSVTVDGKERKAYKLELIKEEAEIIKLIFSKFIETNSLTKTDTYLLQNNITTKNGKNFTRFSIRSILQNPVYMIADQNAWEYFDSLGVEIYAEQSEFDGKHGIMAYNKTIQKSGKSNQMRNMDEWIVAVGKHKGLIAGKYRNCFIKTVPSPTASPKAMWRCSPVCCTVETAGALCVRSSASGQTHRERKFTAIFVKPKNAAVASSATAKIPMATSLTK